MKVLLKSKTFWTGIAGIIASVGGFLTGSLDAEMAVQTSITSLIGIFLRSAIATK